MTELQCELEQCKRRIIYLSMYNDIIWGEPGNTEKCEMNSVTVANYAHRFLLGRWSFLGAGSEKTKPDGDWDKTAERRMLNFAESGHPIFRATSALKRGELRSKAKGKRSIHFNGSEENIELILHTIISVNQLSTYGAAADLCKELSNDSEVAGKLAANEDLEPMEIPRELATDDPHTNARLEGNLLRDYEHKFEQLPENQKISKLCCDDGLKILVKGQFFIKLDEEGPDEMKNLRREYTLPRSEEASRVRGWILGNTKVGPVLDVKVCVHQRRYGIEIMIESLFRDRTVSWVRIVNGINKYVSETSETISLENDEHRVTVKLVAKAKPQAKPAVTLSPISIPSVQEKWIDINPERFCQDCFAVSKAMIRLLRHNPSISRELNGAVRFDDVMEEFKAKFDGTSQ